MFTQSFTMSGSSLELLKPGEKGIVTRFASTDETTIQARYRLAITRR